MKPHDAKILIVEDEPIISLDMKSILEGMGATVTAIVRSADDAIASIERDLPDLILLDLSLSGRFDGVGLARLVGDRWSIPVLFISGHLGNREVHGLDHPNTAGFIAKPFYPVNLCEAVTTALLNLPG